MDKPGLKRLLDGFGARRVLVVGDCMLDEYLWGHVTRISPEAPVQVVEHVETSYAAGGASNVAVNIVALGARASLVAVVGDDAHAARLRDELDRRGVRHEGLVTDRSRPTTVKTRILAHNQQVLRVDREERAAVSSALAAQLLDRVRAEIEDADAILLSDYSKGVLTQPVARELLRLASDYGKPAFANPKPASVPHYRGVNLLSLNQTEAETVTQLNLSDMARVEEAGARLLELSDAEAAVITLGGRGLALFQAGEAWRHLPVVPLEVYDPCGCGDSAIAAATLARAAGATWVEAAGLANLAGTAKVRKLGVVPVSRQEIEDVWAASSDGEASKNGRNGNHPAAEPGRTLGLPLPVEGRRRGVERGR